MSVMLGIGGLFSYQSSQAQVVNTFPYNEDFESFATCGTGCGAACPLTGTTAWTNDLGDNIDWLVDVGGTSSSATGPSVDHNPGTGSNNYLYVETSCSGTGYPNMTANLISPPIDLAGANAMQMEFWWHMFGTSMGFMHVDVSNDGGSTWSNDVIPQWTDNQDLWQMTTVDLAPWSGDTVWVRFRMVTGSSFGGDGAIDDVTFYDLIPNDAGIARLDSPSTPACALGNDVWVTIENYGTDTLVSADVDWEINSVPQTQFNWTGSLAQGSTETFLLGSGAIADGDVVQAWTSLPNGLAEPTSGAGNDSINQLVQTGLSGTYTIGATGDYLTFGAAVLALNQFGVCSAVVFEVEDGTYNEQIALSEVDGMSATNTVTFRSQNADPALVNLTFAGTVTGDNFVIWMDGGDYFHFEDLTISNTGVTYGTCILMQGGASHNTWEGNVIMGDMNVSTTSTNMALVYSPSGASIDSMNSFIENDFMYGSYVMYSYGNGTTDLESGTIIRDNNMTDFYYRGLHMYYQNNMEISGNMMRPGNLYTGSIYRIYMVYADGALRVNNNQLMGDRYGYGIYMSNCDAVNTNRGYVYNNFVHVGDPLSTNTSYGIYMTACNNQVIIYNSVHMESGGTTSRCIYGTGGNQNRVKNNIFMNTGPGFGLYYLSGVVESENNNIYVPNGIFGYSGGNVNDITAWQGLTSFDYMSDTLNPMYATADDLHVCQDTALDMGAEPDTLVMMDIDGQMRDPNTPDIGADEFLGLFNYTLGADTAWFCSGQSVTLGGAGPADDATYLWSTNESTSTINASIAGTYSVLVTTACGSKIVDVEAVVIPDATADFTFASSFFTGIFTDASMYADSIMWDFGDGNTSTMDDPIHVYTTAGTYPVTLTVYGPCGTDTYVDTFFADPTGISEEELNAMVSVFPNPNNGHFNINMTLENNSKVSMRLLTVEGKEVWNADLGTINGAINKNIDLDGVSKGIYFLNVQVDGHNVMKKVVVQ